MRFTRGSELFMNGIPYTMLSVFGFLAVAGVAIFIINLFRPQRPKPMMTESNGLVPFLSLVGVVGFPVGLGLLVCGFAKSGWMLVGLGTLAVVGSILLNMVSAKRKRATWPVVSARCTRQTLQKKVDHEGNNLWQLLLVCEINFAGKNYQVVPKVRWSDAGQSEEPFSTEGKAQNFLAKIISTNGECKLRVNPDKPQEVELLG
jgi:hypothetical protein